MPDPVRSSDDISPARDVTRPRTVLAALTTSRDRAMVLAMPLGGLRRCELLGLRLQDLSSGERRVFVVREGKGGHQRLVPLSAQFFAAVGACPDHERPIVTDLLRGGAASRPPCASALCVDPGHLSSRAMTGPGCRPSARVSKSGLSTRHSENHARVTVTRRAPPARRATRRIDETL